MRQTVFGIFETGSTAQHAVNKLLDSGFTEAEVDVHAKKTADSGTHYDENESKDSSISSFFSNLFGSDSDETRDYSEVAKKGTVVTVHTTSKEESERAAAILDLYGAVEAKKRAGEYRTEGSKESSEPKSGANEKNIPVIEEEMEVGKRKVETGEVTVRSRIIERPVEEHLRLREEHVRIERKPVDRPATETDFNNVNEGDSQVTEHEEVPVVNKESRVVEEVKLNKKSTERKETIRDSVRRTDVDIKKTNKDKDPNRKDS